MANQNETQKLFSLLWLEHTSWENPNACPQDNNPFLSEVQNEFWKKVLDSITHTPKPDKSRYH